MPDPEWARAANFMGMTGNTCQAYFCVELRSLRTTCGQRDVFMRTEVFFNLLIQPLNTTNLINMLDQYNINNIQQRHLENKIHQYATTQDWHTIHPI